MDIVTAGIPAIPSGSRQGISSPRNRSFGDAPGNPRGTVFEAEKAVPAAMFLPGVFGKRAGFALARSRQRESVCTGSTGFPVRKRELHR